MLTSAPFDDWWHNAYGLDVKIISPPHTLLSLGMYSIVIGALFMLAAWQNRAREGEQESRRLESLFLYVGGLALAMVTIYTTEYSFRGVQHDAQFYRVSALAYPVVLIGVARASTARWAATTVAVV